MTVVVDGFTVLCLLGAAFFFLSGTLGILRFPDALSRLHAVTKADNVGLGLLVFGLMPQIGSFAAAAKLVVVWVLVLIASATSSYLIANSVAGEGFEADGKEG